MFNTQILAGSSGQGGGIAQQSLKFNDDETQYLSWTPSSAGNRKTWTWSGWVKRSNLGLQRLFTAGTSGSSYLQIRFDTDDEILCSSEQPSTVLYLKTTQKFRDTSAWYHLVVVMDTTQSTAADRTKLYVNGSLVTDFSSTTRPSQNTDLLINSSTAHMIGALSYGATSNPYDGYLSDIHFIDGQALDASSFGETVDGYWKAKDYAGTYGTNGFHLTFQDDVVSEGFNTVTYRGTGATQSISGLGFEPDFVWIKERNGASFHNVFDSLRVVSGDHKRLYTNSTSAEESSTYLGTTNLTSLDSDGFSLGTGTNTNNSGLTYVGWCWDAGSGSAASNTDGSITSTVKANPSYGFSIATYTGNGSAATIGHGLSSVPELLIVKCRSNAISAPAWPVWHKDLASTAHYLDLQTTAASASAGAALWNNTAPTASVFSVGTTSSCNSNGFTYVSYLFHSVAGYSSIGSYTGTGVAGLSVTTGFRPAFILWKGTDANSWWIVDNTRSTGDDAYNALFPDLSNAESTSSHRITFTDTGFTIPNTNGNQNASGVEYIYMAFADTREAAFWKDVSGQGNHWTPNNLDYRDSLPDSPANNFATLNPLDNYNTGATLSEGNLKWTIGGADGASRSTYVMTSGKWYVEFLSNNDYIGVVSGNANITNMNGTQTVFYAQDGTKRVNGSSSSYGASYANGDIIAIALNMDDEEVTFYKNGASQGTISLTSVGSEGYSVSCGSGSGSTNATANFGQDSTFAGATTAGGNSDGNGIGDFKYAVPSGFLALATSNLPTPTIVDGSEHFNTVLYTGNAGTQSITGVGFDPDFTWAKNRASASYHHELYDTVRGDNKRLFSSQANAEATGYLQFISDGFSLTAGGGINANGNAHVAWNWKAGTAVSNTDGSITSQVSANVDAGFSIVTWTQGSGNTSVGHGLGVRPSMIMGKTRTNGGFGWHVFHDVLSNNGEDQYLFLNLSNAATTSAGIWSTTDSSVFNASTGLFAANETQVAYCFHSVEGYSKVGQYIGNYNVDGPFVYTGFRPAFIIIKSAVTSGYSWYMMDSTRTAYNGSQAWLSPDQTNAEDTSTGENVDILSNGFKIRTNWTRLNDSGSPKYIYIAFAENPFKYANAR
jgi:hypothetical protein